MPSSTNIPNERELLALIAADDEAAFEQIYHHYNRLLFPFILNKSKSQELAEEMVQDIFLKIWAKRKTLPAIDNFRSYLFTMAVNAVYTYLSRAAKEKEILNELWHNLQDQRNSTEDIINLRESEALVQKAIELLPPATKNFIMAQSPPGTEP